MRYLRRKKDEERRMKEEGRRKEEGGRGRRKKDEEKPSLLKCVCIVARKRSAILHKYHNTYKYAFVQHNTYNTYSTYSTPTIDRALSRTIAHHSTLY
jgi:hypothetical protein